MENSSNDFAKNVADSTLLEKQESDLNLEFFGFPGPGDEEEEEEDKEEEGGEEEGTDDSNPPRDTTVVHSPVPTQTGGRPKS